MPRNLGRGVIELEGGSIKVNPYGRGGEDDTRQFIGY